MFRVDVFLGEKTPSSPPLYACLATATADSSSGSRGGCLFTVGRKKATILLEKDKSVSRDHLHVLLLSNDANHHRPVTTESSANDEATTLAEAAGVAQSQAEKDACAQSKDNMTLLVSNKGKFGSAVLALAAPNNDDDENDNQKQNKTGDTEESKPSKEASDSETDAGSDTEDESQKKEPLAVAPGELPALDGMKWFDVTKEISANLTTKHKYTILKPEKLMANEDFLVPGSATTILIQCGQTGSLLCLTKLELQICCYKWGKTDEQKEAERMHAVGATLVSKNLEQFLLQAPAIQKNASEICGVSMNLPEIKNSSSDNSAQEEKDSVLPPLVYMVTPKGRAIEITGKQLAAWTLGIPAVTTEYLEAIIQRKTPQDPWPQLEEFDPPFESSMADAGLDGDFWKKKSPTSDQLWKNCTFVNVDNKLKEVELVVKAAGGEVIQVYSVNDEDVSKQIQALMNDPKKKAGLFALKSKSRKKIVTWIKKQDIPHIQYKEITFALCRQEPLKDADGRVIGQGSSETENSGVEAEAKAHDTAESPRATTKTQNSRDSKDPKRKRGKLEFDDEEAEHQDQSQAKRSRTSPKRGSEREKVSPESLDDSLELQTSRTGSSRKGRKTMPDEEEEDERHEKSQTKLSHGGRESQSRSQRPADILPSVQEEYSMELNDTAASKEADVKTDSRKRQRDGGRDELEYSMELNDTAASEEADVEPESRKRQRDGGRNELPAPKKKVVASRIEKPLEGKGTARLETTADGWLIAAPKDASRRQAYIRPREEMFAGCEDVKPPEVAETVVCTGLVQRKYDPKRNSLAAIGRKSKGVKDFKKFRKNSIIKAPPRKARIALQSVLPQEMERQRELDQQQSAIDEYQKELDELFYGGGGTRQSRITKKATTTRKRRNV